MSLLIGVPREVFANEKRVATVPDVVEKLIKLGFSVAVESGAGDAANCSDDTYRAAGAEIAADTVQLWAKSDIVFKVRPPSAAEVALMREGQTLVGFVWPAQNPELMQQLAAKKTTVLAIDCNYKFDTVFGAIQCLPNGQSSHRCQTHARTCAGMPSR